MSYGKDIVGREGPLPRPTTPGPLNELCRIDEYAIQIEQNRRNAARASLHRSSPNPSFSVALARVIAWPSPS